MKIDKVSINGTIAAADQSAVGVLDAGFTFGLSVFESFRVSRQKIFLLDEHLKRLHTSLEIMNIKQPNQDKLLADLQRLISDFNPEKDLFVRLMVSAGPGDMRLSNQSYIKPNVIIYASQIPDFSAQAKPAKILDSITRQAPEYFKAAKVRLKTNDYQSAHLAQSELARYKSSNKITGHLEGIMLSPDGYAAEALTSNIFWVKAGKIYTSPLSLGILPGTFRHYLLGRHEAWEKLITSGQLLQADEIFLTNSVSYISPLSETNGLKKPGINGPVFKKIFKSLWSDLKNISRYPQISI